MKNSIIAEIYYGNRGNGELIKESGEYWRLIHEAVEIREKLQTDLTAGQIELLDKLKAAETGIESETALTHFTEGFKLGLLIGIETAEQ